VTLTLPDPRVSDDLIPARTRCSRKKRAAQNSRSGTGWSHPPPPGFIPGSRPWSWTRQRGLRDSNRGPRSTGPWPPPVGARLVLGLFGPGGCSKRGDGHQRYAPVNRLTKICSNQRPGKLIISSKWPGRKGKENRRRRKTRNKRTAEPNQTMRGSNIFHQARGGGAPRSFGKP